jgi:FAD/FMN-containing dehydrogenase
VAVLRPGQRAALAAIVGDAHVLVDADLRAPYERDWTGRFTGTTPAVVRPGTVEQVAAVVRWCGGEGVALVPQGGNTGLVGGGVPLGGELVMSLRRLDGIGPVDPMAAQLTASAGATLGAVQRAAGDHRMRYAVDLGARDSATIGGTVATNAGGLHVLRHGATRAQVVGIEAVLGDGSVVSHLGGLIKDNTGYDLAGLLCGSEGTLGIVTAASCSTSTQLRSNLDTPGSKGTSSASRPRSARPGAGRRT